MDALSFPLLSRRWFLTGSLLSMGCLLSPRPAQAQENLPAGTSPKAVDFPHFPDALHAFVWRNWALLPLERMAKTVGAGVEDLRQMGISMGLPEVTPPPDSLKRGALTIIRRNWHLLPYDQLLDLLGWTRAELEFTLKEDDFFFIKLGSLKPDCPPLKWSPPSAAAREKAAWMARIVKQDFPEAAALCGRDPLFSFVQKITALPEVSPRTAPSADHRQEPLRLCYSYFGLYGDPLLDPSLDPYPDGLLVRLRQTGVNAVWLPVVLSRLSPFPWDPQQSAGYEKRRENLRLLTKRAATHGIRIILYLNEPRTQPLGFFKGREQLQGVTTGDHASLCTSAPEVRTYLTEAIASLCREAPELGGFFTITASENHTHCWSHGAGNACPRCGKLSPSEVVAGVISGIAEGIARGGGSQRLIAWDWGWGDWAEDAIARLPARAELMSVSEWSVPITRGGIASEVGEYSLSARGPGPRALRHWKAAQKRGLKVIAKIQAALSWEFSAAPWLPVVQQTADHVQALKENGVEELMLGWTLGGYPSPNFECLTDGPEATARRRAGEGAPALLQFWKNCSQAIQEFPFHIGVVYQAPLQFGPANLLWARPTNYKAAMVGLAYDDLDSWRAIYPPEVFISQLEKTAAGFFAAVAEGRAALPQASPDVLQEFDFAETAALHWKSTALQSRYILARSAGPADRNLLDEEIQAARRLHALQSADSRIGFEASNQYYYIPLDLVEKVLCCRHLAGTGG